MSGSNNVAKVVRSAWQRRLLVVMVERGALAASVVLGAFLLMLLVGTQVLDARWLFLLAAIGLGIAGYQVRQRLLGHYRVAQILDHRLNLADSLSTAWFLLNHAEKAPPELAEFQLRGAERAAASVRVAEAFPFSGARLWSVAGVLALAAASLFSLRYFVTHSLSLEHSLIPFQLREAFERAVGDADGPKRKDEQMHSGDEARSQKKTPPNDSNKDAKDQQRSETPPPPMGNAPGEAGQNPNQPADMREAKTGPGDQAKQRADGSGASQQQTSGEKQGDDGEKSDSSQKSASDDPANNPKGSEGLIDRMKDALSSIAAKMSPNNQGKKQGEGQKSSGQQPAGEQRNGSQEQSNSQQAPSSSMQASEQAQASQGQAQGQTQEKNRAGQGKASEQASGKNSSESHSGIGSQDGDKETRNAEQLKAAGQLAEIIGQRSAAATGDIMVENSAGKQRLQTDYSQRMGRHADLGGEINRDEIPLMYQQYVREYMTRVRKQSKGHKASSPQTQEER